MKSAKILLALGAGLLTACGTFDRDLNGQKQSKQTMFLVGMTGVYKFSDPDDPHITCYLTSRQNSISCVRQP